MSLLRAGRTELRVHEVITWTKREMKIIQEYSPPKLDSFPGVKDIPLGTIEITGALVDSVLSENQG